MVHTVLLHIVVPIYVLHIQHIQRIPLSVPYHSCMYVGKFHNITGVYGYIYVCMLHHILLYYVYILNVMY